MIVLPVGAWPDGVMLVTFWPKPLCCWPYDLEAEPRQRLLHLLEVLADQVAGDLHFRRPLGDRDGDRRPGRDRRAGGGRTGPR